MLTFKLFSIYRGYSKFLMKGVTVRHLFASDYDGTLFKNRIITGFDMNQIEMFRRKGNLFGIATGRNIASIESELKCKQIPYGFIIGINGSAIIDRFRTEIFLTKIHPEVVGDIMSFLNQEAVDFYGITDGYYSAHVVINQNPRFVNYSDSHTNQENVLRSGVSAFFVSCEEEAHANQITETLNTRFVSYVEAFPNSTKVDIVMRGINKLTGIHLVAKYFTITDKLFCIGNALNDLPMIKGLRGFAMSNAYPEIQNAASKVFETVGDALHFVMSEI